MIGRRREQTASLALQTRESVSREGKFESCGEVEKGREHGAGEYVVVVVVREDVKYQHGGGGKVRCSPSSRGSGW